MKVLIAEQRGEVVVGLVDGREGLQLLVEEGVLLEQVRGELGLRRDGGVLLVDAFLEGLEVGLDVQDGLGAGGVCARARLLEVVLQ